MGYWPHWGGARAGLDGTWARGGATHCRKALTRTLVGRPQSEKVTGLAIQGPQTPVQLRLNWPQLLKQWRPPVPPLPHSSVLTHSARSAYGWQCLSIQHTLFFVLFFGSFCTPPTHHWSFGQPTCRQCLPCAKNLRPRRGAWGRCSWPNLSPFRCRFGFQGNKAEA